MKPHDKIGRFEILAGPFLGGFGEVYKVYDSEWGDEFALKTIRNPSLISSARLEEFQREIDLWVHLPPHDNIVRAIRAFEENGRPFVLMEWMGGGNLANILPTLGTVGFGRSWAAREHPQIALVESLIAMCRISTGLRFLHDRGIAHGHIKPGNIMLKYGNYAKISDIGFACLLDSSRNKVGGGTLKYMAPELAWQAPSVQSDIYSTGVMLGEILDCFHFDDSRIENAKELATDMARREPAERVQSATKVLERLDEILQTLVADWKPDRTLEGEEPTEHAAHLTLEEETVPKALPYIHKIQQAGTFAASGQLDQAINLLENVLEERPDEADALLLMANLLARQAKVSQAKEFLARARSACLNDLPRSYNVAVSYAQIRELAAAKEILNDLEGRPGATDIRAEIHQLRGKIAGEAGEVSDAIAHYREALAIKDDPEARLGLMIQLGEAGLLPEAIKMGRKLVQDDALRIRAHVHLARLYISDGQYNAAIGELTGCMREELDRRELLLILSEIGYAYRSKGDFQDATAYYERCLKIDPTDQVSTRNLQFCKDHLLPEQ